MPTTNLDIIPTSKISLPKLVTVPSQYCIDQIVSSFSPDEQTDELSIKVVESKNGYVLVDGIDVYYAAKKIGLRQINAHIINDSVDPQITYVKYTKKDHQNPIKMIRQMRSYVDGGNLTKTIQMMHLEKIYAKIYALEFSKKVTNLLDKMFDAAYLHGVRSVAPYAMLRFISSLDEDIQITIIEKLNTSSSTASNFRWPHNEYLQGMVVNYTSVKPEKKDKPESASSDVTKFECSKCSTPHLVHNGRVTPYKEQSGIEVMEGDITNSVIALGKKHSKHLGIESGDTPEVITSESDWKSVLAKMKGRRFVVLLGTANSPS